MSFEALEVRTQILAHENLANITQIYQNTKKKKKTCSFSSKFHQTYRMQKHKKLKKDQQNFEFFRGSHVSVG
jgi:hypothetical protein